MTLSRFDRFLPIAGVLAGLLFVGALVVLRNDPPSESAVAATFSYWHANRGQHQIIGLIIAPVIAFLLIFFGAGLRQRLEEENGTGYGLVAFGGTLLAAATFAIVGMLEAAMTNAAHEGNRQAVYTLNQLHSYDWLGWNAAFAAVLLATGLGARANRMLPKWLALLTIAIGLSLLTPVGFFGFILLPFWLITIGLWLNHRSKAVDPSSPLPSGRAVGVL